MSTKKNADITIFLLPPAIFTLNIYSIFLDSVLIADSLYDHHKYFYNYNIRKEINFHNIFLCKATGNQFSVQRKAKPAENTHWSGTNEVSFISYSATPRVFRRICLGAER